MIPFDCASHSRDIILAELYSRQHFCRTSVATAPLYSRKSRFGVVLNVEQTASKLGTLSSIVLQFPETDIEHQGLDCGC